MNTVRQFKANGTFPSLPYILTAPEDWDPAAEQLPMIVFLHGAGERGTDPEPLRLFYGIPRLFGEQPSYHGLRVITLSPQCPEEYIWHHLTLPLRELIEPWRRSAVLTVTVLPLPVAVWAASARGR